MQDYIALRIDASPCDENITDLLAAFLCDIGYESFSPDSTGVTAYIQDFSFDENLLNAALSDFPIECSLKFSHQIVKGENWNEEWEKHYFRPIVVDDKCVVHSTFHKDIPQLEFDIVIDPKMAFGTGHHSTTANMMRHILACDMKGKSVIDMGTGTGILAILCKMKEASIVTGIEIDRFAWENAVENTMLNGVEIDMLCGDVSALADVAPADYFLANINRNVIISDIEYYVSKLKPGGTMLLSGFYASDIPVVEKSAACHGLRLDGMMEENDWVALRFLKN